MHTASATMRPDPSRRARLLPGLLAGTLIALFLLSTASATQAAPVAMSAGPQWYWANPAPQGDTIEDVDFCGAGSGWAVGWNGTVLATTDGGVTWRRHASGVTSALLSVCFPTRSHGWATGADGVILHTADGGKHWAPQTSGTSEWLYGIAFADTLHGWAVGGSWDGPVLLATTNGGKTWVPQSSPSGGRLLSLACVDASHAWAVGEGGVLTFTTDGGATWQLRYLEGSSSPQFCAVEFTDGLHGWAVDTYGAVAATVDGGDSWQPIQQDVVSYGITDVAVSGGSLLLAAPRGTVLSRPLAGGAWTTEDTGLRGSLYALAPRGDGLVAAGQAGALATRGAGGGWVSRWRGCDVEFQNASFVDAKHGWAAGQKSGGESVAVLYATTDGGRTWVDQLQDDAMNWFGGLAMADARHGWAAGWGGSIVRTEDGSSWTPQVSPTWPAPNYNAVACGDAQHAVAVGYPGNGTNLSVTADGVTWTTPASGVTGSLEHVDFGDATHVWAVGDKGAITASADAGAGWTPQDSGVTADLKAVQFVDASTGWAAGTDGTIVCTADGGATWAAQASGVTSTINAIGFVTARKGWALTADGEILETRDGGAGWSNAGPRSSNVLNGLAAIDTTHVFAVGGNGTVLGLDVVKPVAKATAPRRVQRKAARVRFKASDAQSGVARIQYRVGKGAWKTGASVTITRRGKTVVSYRATDAAGNTSSVKRVTVRIRR